MSKKLKSRKSWREKLENPLEGLPKVVNGPAKWKRGLAAEEDHQNGKKRITPYWRVVKNDGSLNPKFPGGVKEQAARLKEEGHKIISGKGKKPPKVQDFEKSLA